MSVSAVLVTRGDVPMGSVLDSLPSEWEKIVWDNGESENPASVGVRVKDADGVWVPDYTRYSYVKDLAVYGRYAAIEYASHDLIYVQDDDVIVYDPQAIVDAWVGRWQYMQPDDEGSLHDHSMGPEEAPFLVANMPPEFRHDGYTDSCLVGFGACFHRDAPARAFKNFIAGVGDVSLGKAAMLAEPGSCYNAWFNRTCDVVFTTLTPRVLVDVAKANREFAEDEGRMYRTPGHAEERARMLELARRCRDA